MAIENVVITSNDETVQQKEVRPLAHYHTNLWGDRFLNYTPPNQEIHGKYEEEAQDLKEEVRKKLVEVVKDSKERLLTIDNIEQLGVAYHFEAEIEDNLLQFFNNYSHELETYEKDLHFVSLRFRLLRQHGFYVSCDVFNQFKNEDGTFKEKLSKDVIGMLNLYEASYLRVQGEELLDEAIKFTTNHLKSMLDQLSQPLLTQVTQALKLPLHKGITRLLSRYYISTYEANPKHDETLLRFAKLDFNILQSMHLKELQDLSRWWKDLEFGTKLPFARDRIAEVYFWMLGTLYEPKYALGREIFTKLYKMTSVMDDTYDAYGLFPELQVYTKAVQRWDKSCMNELPDYMKLTYEALLDTFQGFEQNLAQEGRSHLVPYVQELMKAQCRAYFQEAKWCNQKYVPSYDEYLDSAAITTAGYTLMSAATYLGMGELATEEAFEWLSQTPKPVKASCIIGRLIGDIASYKLEKNRDHVASAVQCYMSQYGVSEEEAEEKLRELVEDAWKDLNQEMLRPTKLPRPMMMRILNLSRVIEVFYRLGEDDYSVVSENMKEKIHAVLIDPVMV
ncbi:(-)-drimenol synthase-like [Silene latifolia]|uniref:(-)-drimenol synthase-like n=1 Tax=Silene latifolia TaxID=37657 RepID=UPI003D7728F0